MKKFAKEWSLFGEVLRSGHRPKTFEDTWSAIPPHICGLYKDEAEALWDNLQIINPESIAEIGRNLGGGLFFMCCACPNLEYVSSWDIAWYHITDDLFPAWFKINGIRGLINVQNSATLNPWPGKFDFVWIDGEHTGPGVAKDIEIWHDKVEWIGFHDFADLGRNKHKRCFKDVVREIQDAALKYRWDMMKRRGRSDVVFQVNP